MPTSCSCLLPALLNEPTLGTNQILEIKKDTERGPGGGTSMELTSKGAGTYWWVQIQNIILDSIGSPQPLPY